MARKSKVVKVAAAARVLEGAGLVAVPVRSLDPEVAKSVALYEAAQRGDHEGFQRILNGGA